MVLLKINSFPVHLKKYFFFRLCVCTMRMKVSFDLNTSYFRLDLNAAESGVQHKPSQPGRNTLINDQQANKDSCAC
jgi:hypothetical protein